MSANVGNGHGQNTALSLAETSGTILEGAPVLQDRAVLIEPEETDARIVVIARPLLVPVEDDIVPLRRWPA